MTESGKGKLEGGKAGRLQCRHSWYADYKGVWHCRRCEEKRPTNPMARVSVTKLAFILALLLTASAQAQYASELIPFPLRTSAGIINANQYEAEGEPDSTVVFTAQAGTVVTGVYAFCDTLLASVNQVTIGYFDDQDALGTITTSIHGGYAAGDAIYFDVTTTPVVIPYDRDISIYYGIKSETHTGRMRVYITYKELP